MEAADLCIMFRDEDNDGHGNAALMLVVPGCRDVRGYVTRADDCDDRREDVHPESTDDDCDGIDQDCSGSDPCPPDCYGLTAGSRYVFCNTYDIAGVEARFACEDLGMKLARVDNLEESNTLGAFLQDLEEANGDEPFYTGWIDGDDSMTEGVWRYSDGAPLFADPSFDGGAAVWDPSQPDGNSEITDDEDCIQLWSDSTWSDEGCMTIAPYICESE